MCPRCVREREFGIGRGGGASERRSTETSQRDETLCGSLMNDKRCARASSDYNVFVLEFNRTSLTVNGQGNDFKRLTLLLHFKI